MSDQTIFEGQPAAPAAPATVEDLLKTITADDGRQKYSDVESAIKSIPHAQSHIKKLEQELDELRDELTKRKAAEELLADLKANVNPPEKPSGELSPEALKSLVEGVVTTREREAYEQANAKAVVDAFVDKYGDKAETEFVKLAQTLQVGVQFLNSMAKASPAAVMKLAGLDKKKETPPTSLNTDVNTAGWNPKSPEQTRKPIMTGASTKDLVNEWRRVAPKE